MTSMGQLTPRDPLDRTGYRPGHRESDAAVDAVQRLERKERDRLLASYRDLLVKMADSQMLDDADTERLQQALRGLNISRTELDHDLGAVVRVDEIKQELAAAESALSSREPMTIGELEPLVDGIDREIEAAVAPLLERKRELLARLETRRQLESAIKAVKDRLSVTRRNRPNAFGPRERV